MGQVLRLALPVAVLEAFARLRSLPPREERVAAARGVMLGLALSLPVWSGLALLWLLIA